MSKNTKKRAVGTDVMTAAEVAEWLRIPKSSLYKLCQEDRIPAKKIGRHWRFDRQVIKEWLQGHPSTEQRGTD